jgi:hypothetical protein
VTADFLNENFQLRDTGCSNGVDSAELPVHRWYVIKEAFSPRLVQRAMADAGIRPAETVLDPFCGSGTVPLAAAQAGARGVGIEVNPFLAFVSRTKLVTPRPRSVLRLADRVASASRSGAPSPLERYSTFSSGGGAEKWLFNPPVLRAFESAWREAAAGKSDERDVVRLALLGAAMDSCNASVDGKCLRYKREWRTLRYGRRRFVDSFMQRVSQMAGDLEAAHVSGKARVAEGDSRRDIGRAFQGRFRLCVTSPPYLNSFDYSDVYRPELFLGKFVATTEELRGLRFRTLRSHVQVDWPRPVLDDFGPLYRDCIGRLRDVPSPLWDRRIPKMVQAYFEDMRTVLAHLRKRAHAGAKLWIVVSTSAYGGIEIPVDLILAEVGCRAGWYLREVGVLRYLRTAGQHWSKWQGRESEKPRLRESVIILDAMRPSSRARR